MCQNKILVHGKTVDWSGFNECIKMNSINEKELESLYDHIKIIEDEDMWEEYEDCNVELNDFIGYASLDNAIEIDSWGKLKFENNEEHDSIYIHTYKIDGFYLVIQELYHSCNVESEYNIVYVCKKYDDILSFAHRLKMNTFNIINYYDRITLFNEGLYITKIKYDFSNDKSINKVKYILCCDNFHYAYTDFYNKYDVNMNKRIEEYNKAQLIYKKLIKNNIKISNSYIDSDTLNLTCYFNEKYIDIDFHYTFNLVDELLEKFDDFLEEIKKEGSENEI